MPQSKIDLNSAGKSLLAEVEQLYAKPVQINLITTDDLFYGGQSYVTDNGEPCVRVNEQSLDINGTLIHELYHLLYRHRGIPTCYIPATPQHINLDDGTLQHIQQVFSEVRDRITHALFFNDMRSIGYEPSTQMRHFIKQGLEGGLIDQLPHATARACVLLQALLEVNDPILIKRVEEKFKILGWNEGIVQAQRLANLIRDTSAKTPEQVVDLFLNVTNDLFARKARLSLAEWQKKARSSRFVDHSVVILISSP